MTNIIEVPVMEQYKKDSIEYAIMVNRIRAIPDVRDGLKSVQRKIIIAMYFDIVASRSRYIKSARIVGEVMGKYHPHGDTSIYGAFKPMGNLWEAKQPILDLHGNFGTVLGDGSAAMRYTEARLHGYSLDCIVGDLKETKNAVDWIPTFDNEGEQPEYFPVKVPNLLINGTFGIGYGIKSEVPSHNLGEVIDATINLIRHPNAQVTLIPDHCVPVEIIDTNFKKISNTGYGPYVARGMVDIVDYKGGRQALLITSTPDMVYVNSIKSKIEELMENKVLTQVSDIVNESDGNSNLRIYVVLKRGSDANYVKQVLYQKTDLQKKYSVSFEVLHGTENVRMSYKSYLQSFIGDARLNKFRVYCNRLQKVHTDSHRIEAYVKALETGQIDEILSMIRKQKTVDDNANIEYLVKKLKITDMQARYIINAPNKTLSIGYLNKYKKELYELEQKRELNYNMIHDEALLDTVIIKELQEYKKKYAKPRISKVIDKDNASGIPKGDFKIVITENNFVKKVPDNNKLGSFNGDSPKYFIKGCNTKNILLFNEMGKVYKLPIHQIPISTGSSNGIDVRQMIKGLTSDIVAAMYEPILHDLNNKVAKHFVSIVTKSGLIKKIDMNDLENVPPSGILYIKLDKSDKVRSARITGLNSDIIVYSDHSALRMPVKEVPHQKRNTKGMRSMPVGELIDGMSVVVPNTEFIVVVTAKGYMNRFDSIALPAMSRNKPGSAVIKLKRGDAIKSIISVNSGEIITAKTKNGIVEVPVNDIPLGSSVSGGTKLIPLKNDTILRIGKKSTD